MMDIRFFLRGESGFSILEALMGAGMLGAVALGFSEIAKNQSQVAAGLENRYSKADVEQSIRTAFISPSSCACAFAGKVIAAGSETVLTDLQMKDDKCQNPRSVLIANELIPGSSTMRPVSIKVTDTTAYGATDVVGNLRIDWELKGKSLPLKPTILRNMRFTRNPLGAVVSCGFKDSTTAPQGTGYGQIIFGGRRLTFKNDSGALVAASVQAWDSNGAIIFFGTPAGRTMLLRLREVAGVITYEVPHPNWRKQFCYTHAPAAPACASQSVFGVLQFNCGSPLIWYDDGGNRIGGTEADAVVCP